MPGRSLCMFDKLSCEDTAAAAYEALADCRCHNCGDLTDSADGLCSDLCRDEAAGTVDWNANEG